MAFMAVPERTWTTDTSRHPSVGLTGRWGWISPNLFSVLRVWRKTAFGLSYGSRTTFIINYFLFKPINMKLVIGNQWAWSCKHRFMQPSFFFTHKGSNTADVGVVVFTVQLVFACLTTSRLLFWLWLRPSYLKQCLSLICCSVSALSRSNKVLQSAWKPSSQ